MAMEIVSLAALGISIKGYDASTGVIELDRRNFSLVKGVKVYEIFNETSNQTVMDRKTLGMGASVVLEPKPGNVKINLNTTNASALGTDGDALQILVSVSSSLVGAKAVSNTETILRNSQVKQLEQISQASAQAGGDYGFKLIDNSSPVTANFSTVICMSDGTVLSSSCTTSSGDSDLSNFSLVTGTTITAPWTHVSVDAGAVLAIYSERP